MVLGFMFIVSSIPNITGFAVSEGVLKDTSRVLGIVFVILGLVVIFAGEKSLEERTDAGFTVIPSKKFGDSVKGLDLKRINKAIAKIGTGKGREEKLKYLPGRSIHVDDIGRLRFNYVVIDGVKYVELNKYEPKHEYE